MTHRTIPIEATQESITRPIALDILRDLSKYINFKGQMSEADFHFNINGTATPVPGAKLNDHNANIRLPTDTAFRITLEETPTQDASMVRPGAETTRYMFVDESQYVYLKPIYTPMRARITILLQGNSREHVIDYHKQLMRNLYAAPSIFTHVVNYNIPIPNYVMQALIAIYDAKATYEKGNGLGAWLKEHFDPSVTVISDLNGNRMTYVQKEIGILVSGRFEHNAEIPKPQRDDSIGQWSIETNYEYYYDRCDHVHLQHPISICQSLLPDRFLQIDQRIAPQNIIAQGSEFTDAVGSWKFANRATIDESWYYKQPYFDSWNIHYKPFDFEPNLSLLCAVDGQVESSFCKIDDVEGIKIRDYLVRYMQHKHRHLNQEYSALVQVMVYSWDEVQDPDSYYVDDQLRVISRVNQSVMDQWHVVVGFMTKLHKLKREYWAELAQHACFFRNYLMIYYPKYVSHIKSFDPIECTMEIAEVNEIIEEIITDNNGGGGGGGARDVRTVNRLIIFAEHKE